MKELSSNVPTEILNHPAFTDEIAERYEKYGSDYLLMVMDLDLNAELRNPTIVVEEMSEEEFYQDVISRNEQNLNGSNY